MVKTRSEPCLGNGDKNRLIFSKFSHCLLVMLSQHNTWVADGLELSF